MRGHAAVDEEAIVRGIGHRFRQETESFEQDLVALQPDDIEEERRLCYVGMTRAMDTLILTRAVYRRRYGTDLPEASVPSRFLEEVPAERVGRFALLRHGVPCVPPLPA